MLRQLYQHKKTTPNNKLIYDNFRPTQPLNDRIVQSSFKVDESLVGSSGINLRASISGVVLSILYTILQ